MRVIEREMGYHKKAPFMILRPAGRDNRKRFIIKLILRFDAPEPILLNPVVKIRLGRAVFLCNIRLL